VSTCRSSLAVRVIDDEKKNGVKIV